MQIREGMIVVAVILLLLFMFWAMSNTEPQVKVIDGCEYLTSYDGNFGVNYAHKGNCKNPIHKQKGEQ